MTANQFTIDCEFNGYKGRLLSLAIFGLERSIQIVVDERKETGEEVEYTEWVKLNVAPLLNVMPSNEDLVQFNERIGKSHIFNLMIVQAVEQIPAVLDNFFQLCDVDLKDGARRPVRLHADWPDDVKYVSELLLTGPGTMINIPGVEFKVHRTDSYPTDLVKGAVQHNSWWDAAVLYTHLNELTRQRYIQERAPFVVAKVPGNLTF